MKGGIPHFTPHFKCFETGSNSTGRHGFKSSLRLTFWTGFFSGSLQKLRIVKRQERKIQFGNSLRRWMMRNRDTFKFTPHPLETAQQINYILNTVNTRGSIGALWRWPSSGLGPWLSSFIYSLIHSADICWALSVHRKELWTRKTDKGPVLWEVKFQMPEWFRGIF